MKISKFHLSEAFFSENNPYENKNCLTSYASIVSGVVLRKYFLLNLEMTFLPHLLTRMNRSLIFNRALTCFTQLGCRKISKHTFYTMYYWCCVTKKIVTWHTQRNEERTNSYLSFTGKDRRLQSQSIDNESGNWIKWKTKLNIISLFRYLDGKPCSMN